MNLSTNSVTVRFGAVAALQNVNVKVASGERRAVIGPNGAGKTTLFDVITGQRRPTSGKVTARRSPLATLTLTFCSAATAPKRTVTEFVDRFTPPAAAAVRKAHPGGKGRRQ